jgi:hypothetical protein
MSDVEMREFYNERVVYQDEALKKKILSNGLFARMYTPQIMMAGIKQANALLRASEENNVNGDPSSYSSSSSSMSSSSSSSSGNGDDGDAGGVVDHVEHVVGGDEGSADASASVVASSGGTGVAGAAETKNQIVGRRQLVGGGEEREGWGGRR